MKGQTEQWSLIAFGIIAAGIMLAVFARGFLAWKDALMDRQLEEGFDEILSAASSLCSSPPGTQKLLKVRLNQRFVSFYAGSTTIKPGAKTEGEEICMKYGHENRPAICGFVGCWTRAVSVSRDNLTGFWGKVGRLTGKGTEFDVLLLRHVNGVDILFIKPGEEPPLIGSHEALEGLI